MNLSTGDRIVDAALTKLAGEDPHAAQAAHDGFECLTWGEGLEAITGRSLADFLWYQLPIKHTAEPAEKLRLAAGLGALFATLGKSRYAQMCTAPTTAEILESYQRRGRRAGVKAYRKALEATGYQPPDVPGLLQWGAMMGGDEATCYATASAVLEQEMEAGRLRPGSRGWRQQAVAIVSDHLHRSHPDVPTTSWAQWVWTERLQRWTVSRGRLRERLAGPLGDRLTTDTPVPTEAAQCLASLRWLLDHAAGEGVALTATGNLARAVVAEGCQRFDWLTMTGNPRSESDIPELMTLRDLAAQMGSVRRSGSRLRLTRHGRVLQAGGTEQLWNATMACLPGTSPAQAAAGEIELMLLIDGPPLSYRDIITTVAQALAEEGWRSQRSEEPNSSDLAAGLLGPLHARLRILGLEHAPAYGQPHRLNPAGQAAAHTALRARALRPRTHPYG